MGNVTAGRILISDKGAEPLIGVTALEFTGLPEYWCMMTACPLGLLVAEGARRLGVGRQTLSRLVNQKASVSLVMAYRLSKGFGSTPEV